MLEGDGCDYFILRAGVQATKEAPPEAMTIEIGVRRGGGTAVIWNEMEKMKQKRLHICVDPYGDLPLPVGDQGHRQVYDYGDWMRRQALRDVFAVADEEKLDVLFFLLEDTEFFSRFRDGIPWYGSGKKEMRREYCLAYLDGPHSADAVHSELLFFLPRMSAHGVIVFDDITYYHHDGVRERMEQHGYQLIKGSQHQEAWGK